MSSRRSQTRRKVGKAFQDIASQVTERLHQHPSSCRCLNSFEPIFHMYLRKGKTINTSEMFHTKKGCSLSGASVFGFLTGTLDVLEESLASEKSDKNARRSLPSAFLYGLYDYK